MARTEEEIIEAYRISQHRALGRRLAKEAYQEFQRQSGITQGEWLLAFVAHLGPQELPEEQRADWQEDEYKSAVRRLRLLRDIVNAELALIE